MKRSAYLNSYKDMNLILLSGGFGKRLWPITNDIYSKQFVPLFKDEITGTSISIIKRIFNEVDDMEKPFSSITVIGSKLHKDLLNINVGDKADIIFEPEKHDTFAAIALACSYIFSEKKYDKDEVIAVAPSDHYVDIDYYEYIKSLEPFAKNSEYNLILLGKKLDNLKGSYEYIVTKDLICENIYDIDHFKEKPGLSELEDLKKKNALANCGVFIFKLGYIIDLLKNKYGFNDCTYDEVYKKFSKLPKISFDYEIVEKEKKIAAAVFDGNWADIGSLDELSKVIDIDLNNDNTFISACNNSFILNTSQLPLTVIGLDNVIVSASYDGILVSDKKHCDEIKKILQNYNNRPMYEQKRWGEYFVLDHVVHDDGSEILTKRLEIKEGKGISYQYHEHRTEIWTITKGIGEVCLNGITKKVSAGDVINIGLFDKHSLRAISDLEFIEVQIGSPLIEEDIVRLDY